KLLDFGIAKAADRITRTEAGQVKGKFAYMSPEQCLGKPLDRRSDIFALGIILYELTTGRQLFKRATEHLTFKAICEQPVVPPSEIVPSYPKALEAICMRALARRPADRYATAADMRRDLVKAELGGAGLPEEALASLMQRIFRDRIEEKREMLRRVRSGSGVTRIPPAETDYDVDLPMVDGGSTIRSSPRPRRLGWMALLLLPVAALVAWNLPKSQRAERAFEIPVTVSAPVPEHGDVVLHVETKPPGATILVNEIERGTTPGDVKLPRADEPVDVEVRLLGHRVRKEKVIPNADRRLVWELTRATRAKASASSDDDYYRFP
ncbi:MAG TPA: serine/threonine-protein kinase, partial [Polyangiaceae bacterium]|nr:serine/threonine-protein kinase [Polyangiaceae bacterium]